MTEWSAIVPRSAASVSYVSRCDPNFTNEIDELPPRTTTELTAFVNERKGSAVASKGYRLWEFFVPLHDAQVRPSRFVETEKFGIATISTLRYIDIESRDHSELIELAFEMMEKDIEYVVKVFHPPRRNTLEKLDAASG
ncbi:MAG: hypothetical protein KY459_15130 [Acidobacteria bacterium]|nr:hypothetical protein [Acidobacteriota bacterium]